jgi:hypothetical protein
MKVGYTEFSFGYAFTENLMRSVTARPSGAPVFPNLNQEAELGYDVRIDFPAAPLFFQYKLPELMVRSTAAEISQYALPGISVPFFRMPLMRRDLSEQHALLMGLERRFPGAVYYATSEIEDNNAFNGAYNAGQVHEQSVFFSPIDIGPLPDDGLHVVAYRNGLGHAWLRSEPREISAFRFEHVEHTATSLFGEKPFQTLELTTAEIRHALRELTSPEVRASESAIRQRIQIRVGALAIAPVADARTREVAVELLVSREIARVGLSLDMIIVQPA